LRLFREKTGTGDLLGNGIETRLDLPIPEEL
jgi:hypothetical protein